MGAVLPVDPLDINQAQVNLVNKSRSLERVPPDASLRKPAP
jgi:hypothetical protein